MIPKDKLGKDILPGCFVVYGSGDRMLRIGKVLGIKTWQETRRFVTGDVTDTRHRVTVRGITDYYFRSPLLNSKNGEIEEMSRLLVLDGETLPRDYYDLLEPVPLLEEP